ncbi:hypothetical protein ACWEKT_29360 [Nocardia takedensis]
MVAAAGLVAAAGVPVLVVAVLAAVFGFALAGRVPIAQNSDARRGSGRRQHR